MNSDELAKLKSDATAGDADAQFQMGDIYFWGKGVTKDLKVAVKWWKLSADHGSARAQFTLGVMYEFGYGVIQSIRKALDWYRLAADQGNIYAQYRLPEGNTTN